MKIAMVSEAGPAIEVAYWEPSVFGMISVRIRIAMVSAKAKRPS
jgi:hypothetical protein